MAIHKTADIQHSLKSEAVRALELTNQLHSTLELEKLFEIFTHEIAQHVAYDGLKYTHPEELFSTKIGNQKRHKCQYRLLMGGQNLGEIEFSRSKKFDDSDTIKLEYLLSSLLSPLHNCIMYKQAVTNSLIDPLIGIKNRFINRNNLINHIIHLRIIHYIFSFNKSMINSDTCSGTASCVMWLEKLTMSYVIQICSSVMAAKSLCCC